MNTDRRGFTVMEIFIVVVILGILAAIIVPQFSRASSEARLSYMVSSLQKVRSQIALYQIQHDDLFPGQEFPGDEITREKFVAALTTSSPEGLGPYLEKIPKNPFNELNTITLGPVTPDMAGGAGWFFNVTTGEFRADDHVYHMAY